MEQKQRQVSLSGETVIQARELTKYYNGLKAVDGIDLTVYSGDIIGLLGPNGAGKSTTIRMLYGFTPISSGELYVLGQNIEESAREIKSKIGVVPEESNLDMELTLLDNLLIYASYFDISMQESIKRAEDLLRFLHLDEKKNVEIDSLSHGMKRRALLARSLLNQPELLILDEPTVGLDPQGRHLLWQKLLELKEQGITQILTTHYMEEAARLCQQVFIMDHGKIIARGAPEELIKQHSDSEAVEIGLDEVDEERFIEDFNKVHKIQRLEDRFLLFVPDAYGFLKIIEEKGFKTTFALARPANLEDVFLNLTGRQLKE